VKTTGREKLRMTVMLSVLADERKPSNISCSREKKIFQKKNLLLELYLNVMSKDG
jgi:hypothetical protein